MKILLSAYVCAPDVGSESEVGWNWALALVRRGHEVWVLTRVYGQKDKMEMSGLTPGFHIRFIDFPWAPMNKILDLLPMSYYFKYFLWQKKAYQKAVELHDQIRFDLVHHVTFAGIRSPSMMGRLGIPFIFGPVGGGERTPKKLRSMLSIEGRFQELIRHISGYMLRFSPRMQTLFSDCNRIYVTSQETKRLIPVSWQKKTDISLTIGLNLSEIAGVTSRVAVVPLNVLFVGRFLDWKGMALGLAAFAQASLRVPHLRLTMVGQGPERDRWRQLATKLQILDKIEWIDWVPREKIKEIYAKHHILLLPSFHDSGGMVVLEAMAHALPVICLRLGGPGVTVNEKCGFAIPADEATIEHIVQSLAGRLVELSNDRALYYRLSRGAVERAHEFTWDKLVERVYREFECA
jgi:glycosyltransferase involved in cell wall biosynthesis